MPCSICGAETQPGSNLCAKHKLGGTPTDYIDFEEEPEAYIYDIGEDTALEEPDQAEHESEDKGKA